MLILFARLSGEDDARGIEAVLEGVEGGFLAALFGFGAVGFGAVGASGVDLCLRGHIGYRSEGRHGIGVVGRAGLGRRWEMGEKEFWEESDLRGTATGCQQDLGGFGGLHYLRAIR